MNNIKAILNWVTKEIMPMGWVMWKESSVTSFETQVPWMWQWEEKKIDFVDFNLPVTLISNQNIGFMISKWQFWDTKQPRAQIMLVVLFLQNPGKIGNNYARILKTLT